MAVLRNLSRRFRRYASIFTRIDEIDLIDTRTLAVFRILAGVLIIADLFARARRFSFFYTEDGVVPRSLAMDHAPDHAFSIYFWSTDPTVTAMLFVIQGLIAVQLIVGYKTRLATILSFLLVVSLDHRNMLVTSYADTLFRFLMFWAIFLPLGERWSIDAIHRARMPRPYVASVASAAILVQMVYMYLVNGIHKTQSELWQTGEATVLIFGLDDITFFLGDYMRDFPTLLQMGGLMWFYMLLASPLLLVLTGRARMAAATLFLGGHLAFAFTVRIGAFPYVAIAGVLLFLLQPHFWNDMHRLLRHFRLHDRYVTSRAGVERAGHRVAAVLPKLQFRVPMPAPVLAGAHNIVLGIAIVTVLVVPAIAGLAEADVIGIDVDDLDRRNREATAILGIRQPEWSVFAPSPRRTDRWHVFPAETVDGELLDVYNDRPLSWDRPYSQLEKQYSTYRERFYMNSVRRRTDAARSLGEYICRTWKEDRGIELMYINMYGIYETVTRDTVKHPELRESWRDHFYTHTCGDHEPRVIEPPD